MHKIDDRVRNFVNKKHSKTDKFCLCMMYKYDTDELLAEGINTYENFTTHAEINCIKQLLEKNMLSVEIDIFITKSPCIKCWIVLQNLNIKNIYYIYTYELDFRSYLQPNESLNIYEINGTYINKINNVNTEPTLNTGLIFRNTVVNVVIFTNNTDNTNNTIIEISTIDIIKTIIDMWKSNYKINKIIISNIEDLLVNEIIFFRNFNIRYKKGT